MGGICEQNERGGEGQIQDAGDGNDELMKREGGANMESRKKVQMQEWKKW